MRSRYIGDWNSANQTDEYIISAGKAIEYVLVILLESLRFITSLLMILTRPRRTHRYTPHFTAHGFRFVALSIHPPTTPVRTPSGLADAAAASERDNAKTDERYEFSWRPSLATLTSHFVHTDVAEVGKLQLVNVPAQGVGTFGTADLLGRLHRATRYSQLSNLFSVPTDCPQRERRGWLADSFVSSEQALLQWDMQAFYSKFLMDIAHSQDYGCQQNQHGCDIYRQHNDPAHPQDLEGSLSDVVPYDGIGQFPGTLVWQATYVILVHNHWRHYGDASIVNQHYPNLVKLMEHFQRTFVNATTGLADLEGHGDWVCVGPNGNGQMGSPGSCARTPASLVTAYYWIQCLGFMADLSAVANQPASEVSW